MRFASLPLGCLQKVKEAGPSANLFREEPTPLHTGDLCLLGGNCYLQRKPLGCRRPWRQPRNLRHSMDMWFLLQVFQ